MAAHATHKVPKVAGSKFLIYLLGMLAKTKAPLGAGVEYAAFGVVSHVIGVFVAAAALLAFSPFRPPRSPETQQLSGAPVMTPKPKAWILC